MAVNFMELLGAMAQSGMSPSSESRIQKAAEVSGERGGLSGLVNGAKDLVNRAGQTVGGKDNLTAAGVGALLGALASDRKSSVPLGGVGGGLMGLLGMMAFKALRNVGENSSPSLGAAVPSAEAPQKTFENDGHLILTAMLDAAKADGKIDADELNRITGRMKEMGIEQDGMNYVLSQLQSPMSTEAIVAAVRGRPELAAQVYSASLMAVEVDTPAERTYLERLAQSMGLTPEVVANIEQLVGMRSA